MTGLEIKRIDAVLAPGGETGAFKYGATVSYPNGFTEGLGDFLFLVRLDRGHSCI